MKFVSDERSKVSGKRFGLNVAQMTKFQFNSMGGAGGSEGECVDIEFTIDENVINYRKYPITRVIDYSVQPSKSYEEADLKGLKGEELQRVSELFNAAQEELDSSLIHIIKAYVDESEIQKAFEASGEVSFKEGVKILESLLPKDYQNIKIHLFLQYQWSIKKGQNKTWLEIPKNTKSGKFICPAIEGTWKEVRDTAGLHYTDENGNIHPFTRRSKWLQGRSANQQDLTLIVDDAPSDHKAFL